MNRSVHLHPPRHSFPAGHADAEHVESQIICDRLRPAAGTTPRLCSINRDPAAPAALPLALCLLTLLCLLLTACASKSGATSPGSRTTINELNLLAMPVAVNLDDTPGADGVVLKLFAANRGHPRTLPLRSGTLEIAAYPGTPSPAALPEPFHLWTFTPADLKPCEITTRLGTGYSLTLNWMPQILSSNRVTIIARYLPMHSAPVISAPSFITAAAY